MDGRKDGRKRPAAPLSRGNSPPTQRARLSEQSSITDRGPSQSSIFRKNSAAGLPVHTRTGPASSSTNECHVDQNRRNSYRDAVNGPERLQHGGGQASSRKSSTDQSPIHVMSPLSHRSGSSTPVQVAPIVPFMLPVAQKAMASHSAPMNSLNALRSHKASLAMSVAQATGGAATQEMKVLKAQLRAAQLQETQLRYELKKLEDQLKRFEVLPVQLAALKDLVEQQQQAAAKGPSPEDIQTRLNSLENAKPAIETARFVELQSDVQTIKTKAQKLDDVPEQLKQLQATVIQHGEEITKASSKHDKLKIEVEDLMSIREDVKTVKEQQTRGQGVRGESIKKIAQGVTQPEVARLEAILSKHRTTIEELSTRAHGSQKTMVDVSTKVNANQRSIENMSTALEASRRTSDELRAQDLPANLKVLQEQISNPTDKHPIDLRDFKDLQEIVCGLGEEKEKLVKDLQEAKVAIGQLQQKSQPDSVQGIQTITSDEHKKLSERVTRLESATNKSASAIPSAKHNQLQEAHDQLKESCAQLENKVEHIHKSHKALQLEHETTNNHIKAFANEQIRLSDKYNTIVDRVKASEKEQARLSEEHSAITNRFETFEARLFKEHNEIVNRVNKYHEEQVGLHSQQKLYQTDQDKLHEEHIKLKGISLSLESRVTAFEKTVNQVKVLANAQKDFSNAQQDVRLRITTLETAPVPAADQSRFIGNNHTDTVASSSRIDGLENTLRSVEDHVRGAGGLSTRCNQLQKDIEEVKEDIADCQDNVDLVQKSIIGIFGEIFDPFKASVEEKFKEHTRDLIKTHQILTSLQTKVEEPQKECPAATFSAPQLTLIHNMVQGASEVKQALSRLQDSVHMEVEQRNAALEDLKHQVAIKQDVATATQAIDVVKTAVRNLQNQYDNISTDDLHQKMVHWFLQNYPQPSASLLQQFATIQHEITQLRKFTDVVTRIPNSAQTLSTLVKLGTQLNTLAQLSPQLTALVQSPPATEGPSKSWGTTSESLKAMKDSVAKAHQQHDDLAKVIGNLQTSLHSLNSNNTPFARVESFTALEKSIATLRAELKASIGNELRARKEFETKASREHDQRIHAETSIKASIQDLNKKVEKEVRERKEAEQEILSTSNEKFKELEKDRIKTPSDQSETLQKALDQLRSDFDKALKDFNDPENKELLGWLPTLFLHVGQLQWVLEDLNQNLPKGGLEIEWTSDWKDEFSVPSPFPNSGEAAGQCKGKRQA